MLTSLLRIALPTVAAAAALSASITAGAEAHVPSTTKLTLFATATGGGSVDNAPKGPSVGDAFYETVSLKDAAGHAAGDGQISGQLVGGTTAHGTEQVAFTLFLHGGQIAAVGGHATVNRFTVPVAGGTGKYAGASGTLRITPGPHHTERADLTLLRR